MKIGKKANNGIYVFPRVQSLIQRQCSFTRMVIALPGKQLWGREGGTFLCLMWDQLSP